MAEYGTYKPGANNPPWFIRAAQGKLWRTGQVDEIDERSLSNGTEASEKELVDVNGKAVGPRQTTVRVEAM